MTSRTFAAIAFTLVLSACGGEPLRMTSAGGVDMSGARGGAIETRTPPRPAAHAAAESVPEPEPTMIEVSTPPVEAPADTEVAVATPDGETTEPEEPPAVEESPPASDARSRRRERRSRRRRR